MATIDDDENVVSIGRSIEEQFEHLVQDYELDEIFEMFDISPVEALCILFENGQIDEDILDNVAGI